METRTELAKARAALGYDRPLSLLAFDHRGSFGTGLFGIEGPPSPAEAERIADVKRLIYEGFARALSDGAPPEGAGILVDEEFGAEVAHAAKAAGVVLAMPVERSGQAEFDFEYGEAFGDHVEAFEPDFAKVLVRYNAEGDRAANARQAERLRRLGAWLHEHGRRFLFELLVPAEPEQLDRVGGDVGRFDRELRPRLVVAAVRELQDAGVEPDVWKIEGLDEREDCERVAAQARADGRDGVACVVLGRGADEEAVRRWLRTAAGVPGFVGFAVGRTLWWDELRWYVAGELERGAAAARIASNYRRMCDAYRSR